jgi:hypothetical protein
VVVEGSSRQLPHPERKENPAHHRAELRSGVAAAVITGPVQGRRNADEGVRGEAEGGNKKLPDQQTLRQQP